MAMARTQTFKSNRQSPHQVHTDRPRMVSHDNFRSVGSNLNNSSVKAIEYHGGANLNPVGPSQRRSSSVSEGAWKSSLRQKETEKLLPAIPNPSARIR